MSCFTNIRYISFWYEKKSLARYFLGKRCISDRTCQFLAATQIIPPNSRCCMFLSNMLAYLVVYLRSGVGNFLSARQGVMELGTRDFCEGVPDWIQKSTKNGSWIPIYKSFETIQRFGTKCSSDNATQACENMPVLSRSLFPQCDPK